MRKRIVFFTLMVIAITAVMWSATANASDVRTPIVSSKSVPVEVRPRGQAKVILSERAYKRMGYVRVPDMRGKTSQQAGRQLEAMGFKVFWNRPVDSKYARDTIGAQTPESVWRRPGERVWIAASNGPAPTYKWETGSLTWYSIADNTPRGSTATSSRYPLGWNDGWTFASTRFPEGTKMIIKSNTNGSTHEVICTDRGGYRTIDLFRPAYDRLGMDDDRSFDYAITRWGWNGTD